MSQSTYKILEMSNNIVPFLILLGAFFFIGLPWLKKKGYIKTKYKSEKEEKYNRSIKQVDIQEFNVIEEFDGNIVITENKTKFTTGVRCIGISMNALSSFERRLIEDNALGFNTMIDWSLQYYIQSVQMDSEDISKYTRDSIDAMKEEYTRLTGHLAKLTEIVAANPNRSDIYEDEIKETERVMKSLISSIQHKEEIMGYCKAVTSSEAEPVFNMYILYSYAYDASLFTEQLSEQEIRKEAKNYLETKTSAIIGAMKKCMVTSKELSPAEMAELQYRAYNLSDADIVKFKDLLKTSQFDLYTTTDYFAESRLMTAMEILSEEITKEEAALVNETI